MSRARDNANLGTQAGSGLDASDITSGALGASVTGGAGLGVSTATTTALNGKLPLAGGTMTGNIVMGDDTSIGIADDAERIEFDGAGDISVLGANLGIGTDAPASGRGIGGPVLHISGTPDAALRVTDTGGSDFEISAETNTTLGNIDATDLIFITNNSEKMRIESAGDTIIQGDLKVVTGKGINFYGGTDPDTAGTATGNILNDYEEGTWTPTNNHPAGITLSGSFSSSGWYTKSGNIVTVTGWIQGSGGIAITSGTSSVVGGLPFQIGSGSIEMRYTFQVGSGGVGGHGYAWSTAFYQYSFSQNVSSTSSKIFFHLTYKV